MSGPLVGLVNDHGPEDHNAWAVLSVLAELLHGPLRSYDVTNEALATRARLSVKSVKRGVAVLVADGWVARQPGRHKGRASTYRLRLEAFPAEAVEKVLERGSHRPPNDLDPESIGGHTDPLRTPKGVTQSTKGVTQTPHSVSVPTPSSSAHDDSPLPGVLVGVAREEEGEVITTTLEGLPVTRTARILRAIPTALEAGWTASALNQHLRRTVDPAKCANVANVVATLLEALPPAPQALRARCGECDANRMREDHTGHPYPCPECHPRGRRTAEPLSSDDWSVVELAAERHQRQAQPQSAAERRLARLNAVADAMG